MRTPASLINKHGRDIKVRLQYYIKNKGEPRDSLSHDTLAKDETILIENSPPMRRRFRLVAQRFRAIKVRKKIG